MTVVWTDNSTIGLSPGIIAIDFSRKVHTSEIESAHICHNSRPHSHPCSDSVAKVVLFSAVYVCSCVYVCVFVTTITVEPFEIPSWYFYGSKIWSTKIWLHSVSLRRAGGDSTSRTFQFCSLILLVRDCFLHAYVFSCLYLIKRLTLR